MWSLKWLGLRNGPLSSSPWPRTGTYVTRYCQALDPPPPPPNRNTSTSDLKWFSSHQCISSETKNLSKRRIVKKPSDSVIMVIHGLYTVLGETPASLTRNYSRHVFAIFGLKVMAYTIVILMSFKYYCSNLKIRVRQRVSLFATLSSVCDERAQIRELCLPIYFSLTSKSQFGVRFVRKM